jgi:hypothetical protein
MSSGMSASAGSPKRDAGVRLMRKAFAGGSRDA